MYKSWLLTSSVVFTSMSTQSMGAGTPAHIALSTGLPSPVAMEFKGVATTDTGTIITVSRAAPKAAILIFPGAYMEPAKYTGLAQAIVARSNGEIAVFLAHFTDNFANAIEAGDRVDEVVKIMTDKGLSQPSKRVFVAGHSQGGITASDSPVAKNLGGLILLGSYLPHTVLIGKELKDYTAPVLTLGAELDGLTGINYMAREAAAVQTLAEKSPEQQILKPVVIIRGLNHMQFADGTALAGDTIPAQVPLTEAHSLIAGTITNFVKAQGDLFTGSAEEAKRSLKASVSETLDLVAPFLNAKAEEAALCPSLQRVAAPFAVSAWNSLKVDTKIYRGLGDQLGFIFDKAQVSDQGRSLHLAAYIDQALDIADISQDNYLSPNSIDCKMRAPDALSDETGLALIAAPATCAQMNEKVILETLALVTDEAQKMRLTNRYGDFTSWSETLSSDSSSSQAVVGPFTITSTKQATGQDWVSGSFKFAKSVDRTWALDTVEVVTAKDVPVKLFAGADYCKVIAPERVIEWATLFGLK